MPTIKIKKIHPKAVVPKTSTKGSACFDLCSCEDFVLANSYFKMVKTGLVFEIPEGYHVEVYIRSGMAKKGVIIPNAPGIIDSDYRGELVCMLYGLFMKGHEIFPSGSRIAQCRLVKNVETGFETVEAVSNTTRGSGGFGSTGK